MSARWLITKTAETVTIPWFVRLLKRTGFVSSRKASKSQSETFFTFTG